MKKNVANQRVEFSLFKEGERIEDPTIAEGDFKVAIDDGMQANVDTDPTSDAAGKVTWLPTQDETNGDYITLLGKDAAGEEWEPVTMSWETELHTLLASYLDAAVSSRSSHDDPDPSGYIDAAISSRSSHAAADVWSVATRTLTSFGTLVADVWDRLTSALTTTGSVGKLLVDYLDAAVSSLGTIAVSATDAESVASGVLSITTYYRLNQAVTSTTTEDLESATKLWLAIKRDDDDADAEALVFIEQTEGLEYLDGEAIADVDGVDSEDGALVVGGESGDWTVTVTLEEEATAELHRYGGGTFEAEVKALVAGQPIQVWTGKADVWTGTVRAYS